MRRFGSPTGLRLTSGPLLGKRSPPSPGILCARGEDAVRVWKENPLMCCRERKNKKKERKKERTLKCTTSF